MSDDTPSQETTNFSVDGQAEAPAGKAADPKTMACETCRGTGLKDGAPDATELCATCSGSGTEE